MDCPACKCEIKSGVSRCPHCTSRIVYEHDETLAGRLTGCMVGSFLGLVVGAFLGFFVFKFPAPGALTFTALLASLAGFLGWKFGFVFSYADD